MTIPILSSAGAAWGPAAGDGPQVESGLAHRVNFAMGEKPGVPVRMASSPVRADVAPASREKCGGGGIPMRWRPADVVTAEGRARKSIAPGGARQAGRIGVAPRSSGESPGVQAYDAEQMDFGKCLDCDHAGWPYSNKVPACGLICASAPEALVKLIKEGGPWPETCPRRAVGETTERKPVAGVVGAQAGNLGKSDSGSG